MPTTNRATEPIIEVERLKFSYFINEREVPVLNSVSFRIFPGEFVAIQGPSGSGKSTLFYVLGCMLRFKSGRVAIGGKDISHLTDEEMAGVRNRFIGFIFQQFHLLPRATVLQNILLPVRYREERSGSRAPPSSPRPDEKASALAARLGLTGLLDNNPNQLSGGQQQRVAIARALMNDVDVILADEPTGNLDSHNSSEIMELLRELNRQGKTIVLITHDSAVAAQCSRTLLIRDGVLTEGAPLARRAGDLAVETSGGAGGASEASNANKAGKVDGTIPARTASDSARPPFSLFRWFHHWFHQLKNVIPLSGDSLKRNKTRSALTMLGVTIGIASVLSMVTFGQFTKKKILESYEVLGVNKVTLSGYMNWRQKATDKTPVAFREFDWEKDALPLREIFPETELIAPTHRAWNTTVAFNGHSLDQTSVIGTTPDYLAIANRQVLYGRNMTQYQVESANAVCLIGTEIVEKAFININPLGQIMFITDGDLAYPCRVIGVMKSQSSNKDWFKPNLQVIMPYTYFKNVANPWEAELHTISLQAAPRTDMESYAKAIRHFFMRKYRKAAEFWVDSDTVLIAQMKKFLTLFTVMLSSIALVTLAVGGIGINNMMLVSVNERLREIGLLKALGATDKSIRLQFLMEAVTLCFVAGIVGIVVGFSSYEVIIWAAAKFVGKMTFEWVFDPLAFGISVFAIIVVGLASGVTPAMKAEKLEVIEALRSE